MWKALTDRTARTGVDCDHPELGGRTYAIPFDAVWEAAVSLVSGGLRGWTRISDNEAAGIIEARVRGALLPLPARAVVAIALDADAQTRVDVRVEGRHRGGDLGAGARRIRRLVRALDLALDARPEQILAARSICPDVAAVES